MAKIDSQTTNNRIFQTEVANTVSILDRIEAEFKRTQAEGGDIMELAKSLTYLPPGVQKMINRERVQRVEIPITLRLPVDTWATFAAAAKVYGVTTEQAAEAYLVDTACEWHNDNYPLSDDYFS